MIRLVGLYDRDYMKRQGRNDPYYGRLFDPPSSARGSAERNWGVSSPAKRGRGVVGLLVLAAITLFGLFVLPHLAIGGHHYRFWMF